MERHAPFARASLISGGVFALIHFTLDAILDPSSVLLANEEGGYSRNLLESLGNKETCRACASLVRGKPGGWKRHVPAPITTIFKPSFTPISLPSASVSLLWRKEQGAERLRGGHSRPPIQSAQK